MMPAADAAHALAGLRAIRERLLSAAMEIGARPRRHFSAGRSLRRRVGHGAPIERADVLITPPKQAGRDRAFGPARRPEPECAALANFVA